jgi:glycosyltransferase involved in cell wall biosynthesis
VNRSGVTLGSSGSAQVLVVTPYAATDASSRTRVQHWLERTGVRATQFVTGNPMNPIELGRAIRAARRWDGSVFLSRHAHPLGQGMPERFLLRSGQLGVYDLDDGLPFDDGRLPLHGRWWKPLVAKSRIANVAASSADRVIAGNEVLAEWARSKCRDVVVIPTCVEPSAYVVKHQYGLPELPTIGWIGSPATEPHLFSIAEGLAKAHRRRPFQLVVVSSGERAVPLEIEHFTSRIPWSVAVQHSILAAWDVGIMPLPDLAYERSKCAYKLLQYGCAGLPVIGSPVGASTAFLSKVGAQSPRTNDDWAEAVVDLLAAPEQQRLTLGLRGREVVVSDYSYDAWEPTWRTAVGIIPKAVISDATASP